MAAELTDYLIFGWVLDLAKIGPSIGGPPQCDGAPPRGTEQSTPSNNKGGKMEWWIAEAMDLAQRRASLLDDEHAADLADDMRRAWPEMSPAEAVDKFFSIVLPLGWTGVTTEPAQRAGCS